MDNSSDAEEIKDTIRQCMLMYPQLSRLLNGIPTATDQQVATICTFQDAGPYHKLHADNDMKSYGWLLMTYTPIGSNMDQQWYLNPRGGYTLHLEQALLDEVRAIPAAATCCAACKRSTR
jgi:hypothetical protein